MNLELLKDDANYYGEMGKQFLSNSDIDALLRDPSSFKRNKEKTVDMVKGSYFHTMLIEKDKIDNFTIVNASSRNTNIYKDACADGEIRLLSAEKDMIVKMAEAITGNITTYDMVYDDVIGYEVPMVREIMGLMWKGKADIVKADIIYDLKTTSKMDDFMFSARKYNYDSQAWLYNQFFGKPMEFIVVEKETNRVAVFDCSEEFLDRGREKVTRAVEQYHKFFGPKKTEDVSNFIIKQTL